tara:strand:- start:720 stop:869 length:150 start_codon:yes stop_codon:yes gene_type:complete
MMKHKPEHTEIEKKLLRLRDRNNKLLEETDNLLDHNRKILEALIKANKA